MQLRVVAILVLVRIAIANINTTTTNITTDANLTTTQVSNDTAPKANLTQLIELDVNNTRRKCRTIKKRRMKHRSTSSSSGEKVAEKSEGGNAESLDLSGSSISKTESRELPPNSNATGWRRWHRRCTPCLEDMMKKWRDPAVSWICGAYQRARRSFKSECMMYFRNCQDGTMFTKIHEHRCSDADIPYHGTHFFYDYKVKLSDSEDSDDSKKRKRSSSSSSSELQTRSSETIEDLLFRRDTQAKRTLKKKQREKKGKKSKSSKQAKRQSNSSKTVQARARE